MLDGLGHLVHTIIRASPVQDPHMEWAEKNRIVDMSPIYLSEPFCPSDHVCPEMIIKEEVREDIPPPLVVNNCLIVWLILLDNSVESILGDL